jgi:hypothetical protein
MKVKKYPKVKRIVEEKKNSEERLYSYQEFKEKLASSLNRRFNAGIKP